MKKLKKEKIKKQLTDCFIQGFIGGLVIYFFTFNIRFAIIGICVIFPLLFVFEVKKELK